MSPTKSSDKWTTELTLCSINMSTSIPVLIRFFPKVWPFCICARKLDIFISEYSGFEKLLFDIGEL